jgi:S1-C subfamily serine protease
VRVTVVRSGGTQQTFNVKLAAVADSASLASASSSGSGSASAADAASSKLGFSVESMSPQDASQVAADLRGPVVTDVQEDGPGYGKVFGPGPNNPPDVILRVDGTRVRTAEELQRAVARLHKGQIASLIVANGSDTTQGPRIVRIEVR